MANTMTTNPAKIIVTSSDAVKLGALDMLIEAGLNSGIACAKVLSSGTVYFNVGSAPDTVLNPGYTSSDTIAPISFGSNHDGDGDIYYKSASGVSFAITF